MESFRAAVDHADRNPSKVVSYAWYLVLVRGWLLVLGVVVVPVEAEGGFR